MQFVLSQQHIFRKIIIAFCVGLLFIALPLSAAAQFNPEINYQGKLTNASGVAVPDGLYNMNFWLVPTEGGATSTAVWSEARTSGNRVQVTNGLFSVMLGEVSTLDSVDFNQTLYLGVEIGGISTTTPAWDGEMSPRKIIGAVPAAFVAETASSSNALSGIASSSFLRSDEADTMQATSSSPILSIIQNGAGAIARFFSGVTEVFTILGNGNVGVGTSTPSSAFAVSGTTTLAGNLITTGSSTLATTTISRLNLGTALTAVNGGTGLNTVTQNQLLIGGAGNTWTQVATSSLGLGNGTFLGLSDTPSSYTANRVIFTNSGATALTDSANFTFDGTNLGLGAQSRIAFGGTNYIYASSTNDSVVFGENAGATFTNLTTNNVAIGFEAGRYASTSVSDDNIFLGTNAGYQNTGSNNNILGNSAGYQNTGSYNSLFGTSAGFENTGSDNIFLGTNAGYQNTGSNNNIFGENTGFENTGSDNNIFGSDAAYQNTGSNNNILGNSAGYQNTGSNNNILGNNAGYSNTGNFNEMIGYESGMNLRATSSIIIGAQAFRGASSFVPFSAVNNVALGYRAGYNATNTADNNILIGYQVADNLTTGNNNIIIGYDIDNVTATADNRLNIGNLIFGTGLDGTGTTLASGNIGIGSTTPSARLTVQGASGSIAPTFRVASSTGSTTFTVLANGNVGIGTSTPSNKLDILGGGINIVENTAPQIPTIRMDLSSAVDEKPFIYATANRALDYGIALENTNSGGSVYNSMRVGSADIDFSLVQGGGDGLAVFSSPDGGGNILSMLTDNGNVGIGTTTQASKLTVVGDMRLTGAFRDGANASGTLGMVLQTTGTTTRWVATSSLGFTSGATTFLGLTDTPSSYTANRVIFTNTGATALTDSANFTFDGTNLGLGAQSRIAFGGTNYIYASSTNDSIVFGENAGATFTNNTLGNVAIGYEAGRYASSSNNDFSVFLGYQAGRNSTSTFSAANVFIGSQAGQSNRGRQNIFIGEGAGDVNNADFGIFFGSLAGQFNTGSYSNLFGYEAGRNNTGLGVNFIGSNAGYNNSAEYVNAIGWNAGVDNTGSSTNIFGYEAGRNNTGSSSNLFGREAGRSNDGDYVNLIGQNAGRDNQGDYVNFFGFEAGATSTGAYNNFIGYRAGADNTGEDNNIFGREAGRFNSASGNNIFGWNAGYNNSGQYSNLFGIAAGEDNTGGAVNALGYRAGQFNTGEDLNAFGYESGRFNQGAFNNFMGAFAGSQNDASFVNAFGLSAGSLNTGSSSNLFGPYAGYANTGDYVDAIGALAGYANTGNYNSFIGYSAGATSTGSYNIALGYEAAASSSNNRNNFIGYRAGQFNTAGFNNIIGHEAGYFNTGNLNNLIGDNAGRINTGTQNNIFGFYAGEENVGNYNSFIGSSAGRSNTGSYNNLFGFDAGYNNAGTFNNIFGYQSGFNNTGSSTNLIGYRAGYANTGNYVTAIGELAGRNNTGNYNSFIGYSAGATSTGSYNVALGYFAGASSTGSTNNFLGRSAGEENTGSNNNIFGWGAGYANTGDDNSFFGDFAGGENTGNVNIFIGGDAGYSNIGNDNYFIGSRAGYDNTGDSNNIIGESAGYGNTGDINNIIGYYAGNTNTGSFNDFIGYSAGNVNTGDYNQMIGSEVGYNLRATSSSIIGAEAFRGGSGNTPFSAVNNVALGYRAGYAAQTGSDNNILIGYRAADNLTTGNNNIIIGYDIDNVTATADNRLNIGNLIFGTGLDGTGTTLASGNVGIGTSTPASKLSVAGDLRLTGAFRDGSNASGTLGMVLQSTGTSTRWVATSSLGISGGSSLFTDGGATTYLTATGDNLAIGTTSASSKLTIEGDIAISTNVNLGQTSRINVAGERYIHGYTLDNTFGVNQFFGFQAGNFTSGSSTNQFLGIDNIGIGRGALSALTEGSNNTAVGMSSMSNTTSGASNTSVGWYSLLSNTTGNGNTAVGRGALQSSTIGRFNNAFGNSALENNISGENNVALGAFALLNSTTSNNSVAIGHGAGGDITTGWNNTIVGAYSGAGITIGDSNTIIGANVTGLSSSLANNIIIADGNGNQRINVGSTGNVGIGTTTASSRLTVVGDTYITGAFRDGSNASGTLGMVLQSTGTSTRWVATSTLGISSGGSSLFTDGGATTYLTATGDNLAIGTTSASSKLTIEGDIAISDNVNLGQTSRINVAGERYIHGYTLDNTFGVNQFFGFQAGNFTSGSSTDQFLGIENLGIGRGALSALTEGSNNTAVGMLSMQSNTTGALNTGLGYRSLVNNTSGGSNTGLGSYALGSNTTGFNNTGVGTDSLQANTIGGSNAALGGGSLYANTEGNDNSAFGFASLYNNSTGSSNSAFGWYALNSNTTGGSNVAIGESALRYNATGSQNIAIGASAATNLTSGNRNIIIGNNVDAVLPTGSNQLNIGNIIFGTNVDGTGNTLSSGNIGIGTSTPGSKLTVAGDVRVTSGIILGNEPAITLAVKEGNLALGTYALMATNFNNVYSNTAVGMGAATSLVDGWENTFIGDAAGVRLSTTSASVVIGAGAAGSAYGGTSAGGLVIIGRRAGYNLTDGANYNTIIGTQAGLAMTSGNSNTLLGYQAGDNITTGSNNIVIGSDIDAASTTRNNTLNIGNLIFGTGLDGTGTTLATGNVGIGTTSPSARLTVQGASGTTADTFRVASSSGATALAVLANRDVEVPGQIISAGIEWTARSAAGNTDEWRSVAYGNGRFVAVGDADYVMTSPDGVNWSTSSVPVTSVSWTSVTYGNGLFVAVGGNDGEFITSPDGITWTSRGKIASNYWTSVTYGNGLFVVVGDFGSANSIATSPDGITWTPRTRPANRGWNSVVYGNGRFVAVAYDGTTTDVMTSLDGISWVTQTVTAYGYNSVTYGNGLFVAVAGGPSPVITSPDGVTWTSHSAAGGDDSWGAVTYNDGLFVAVGSQFSTNDRVMTSPDGINWTARSAAGDDDYWNAVTYGNGRFVAVGDATGTEDAVMTSGKISQNALATNNIFQGGMTIYENLRLSTTTTSARLGMERLNFAATNTAAGIDQYFSFNNSSNGATIYGNRSYIYATNTATTTVIGSIMRVADSTTFGNTVRGLEVQADNGNNTRGENTGIAAFGRTFGVRGTTVGDAGGTFEPAGIYGETEGTTQGNAIRGYSSSITTAALLKLFQDTSAFTGTGLLMNFGNAGGSFSSTTASRFIDLQNAGTSRFTVGAYGMTTIGDGTTNNNAGLQIGYGGICVDNDGSCVASTTGRITAVSYTTANSDLAETYFSSEDLQTGEVVYLKGELSIGRASEETEEKIIGVVTTKPGLLLGSDDTSLTAGEDQFGVALAGRVPVRLSNENGEIKAGDELMLSSIPGVAMKASSTGVVVGIALEDFDETRAYSDTYINQFGDDIAAPVYTPVNSNTDPRINDGCYYGAGSASGEAPCVPLQATTTDAQVAEAEALALAEAQAAALEALKDVNSEVKTLPNGETVRVGQIVMFVSLDKRYLDEDGKTMIAALLAAGEGADEDNAADTIWSRLVTLANNFIDGVLSVLTLKADRVEVQNEICVDGVCLNAEDIRQLLDGTGAPAEPVVDEEEPTPTPEPEPTEPEAGNEPVTPPTPPEDETGTSTEETTEVSEEEETGTEEVVEEPVTEAESTEETPEEELEETEEVEEVVEEVEPEPEASTSEAETTEEPII